MRLEDMKNDIPETPDFIHNMIQNEVAKQLADNKVANLRRRKRWTAPKVAAVAAACVLAVSTAVYAGVNLYHWFLENRVLMVFQSKLMLVMQQRRPYFQMRSQR